MRAARCRAFAAEDGTSLKRAEIAIGKAHGALAMGLGSRTHRQDGAPSARTSWPP